MPHALPPALVLNTDDPGYLEDPYGVIGSLREREPVSRVVIDGLPVWLVTRYEDAVALLSDPAFATDPRHAGPEALAVPWAGAGGGLAAHMLRSDPPDHTRLRRLVVKAFTPRRVAGLEPRIRQIAEELLAALPDGDAEVDLMAGYAEPLPIIVITELFGVDPTGLGDFVRWSRTYIDEIDPVRRGEAIAQLGTILGDLVRSRTAELADSGVDIEDAHTLLDGLILARDGGDRLDEAELAAMAFLILAAGYETTANLIGNGALLLLRHPEQMARLAADPSLIPAAVEEFLRFDGPVKLSAAIRYARHDTRVADTDIRAGDPVMVHYSAANRDPRRFADAEAFDFERSPTGADGSHLAFSHGLHYCLGAPLARLEGRIAFETLLAAYPEMRLAGPADKVERRVSRLIRGLARLPVVLGEPSLPSAL
jgi:cytochrome P450